MSVETITHKLTIKEFNVTLCAQNHLHIMTAKYALLLLHSYTIFKKENESIYKTQMMCMTRKRYNNLDFTACAIKLDANNTANSR